MDVLRVMRTSASLLNGHFEPDAMEELEAARTLIADLISADKEVDEVGARLRALDRAGPRYGSYATGWETRDAMDRKQLERRFDAAIKRRADALSAAQGGKSDG